MKRDIEVTIKIPAEWIKEINSLLNNEKLEEWFPESKSYESFIMQAVLNEMHDLNDMIGIRLEAPPKASHPVPEDLRKLILYKIHP